MSTTEQQTVREQYYGEAIRYMDNAKEYLQKAGRDDNYYQDTKYVSTVCGTAYRIIKKIKPAVGDLQ